MKPKKVQVVIYYWDCGEFGKNGHNHKTKEAAEKCIRSRENLTKNPIWVERSDVIKKIITENLSIKDAANITGLKKGGMLSTLNAAIRAVFLVDEIKNGNTTITYGKKLREIINNKDDFMKRFDDTLLNLDIIASHHRFPGLSKRTGNAVSSEGYKTKEEILDSIKSGDFNVKEIPNLGDKGVAELMSWLKMK